MGIYFYAPELYPGTRELIAELGARRLRKHDGMHFLNKGVPIEFNNTDVIICWGSHVPPMENATVLNSNYSYTSQFQANLRMNTIPAFGSYAITPIVHMPNYQRILAQLNANNWALHKSVEGGYVPSKNFPGYGTHFYSFGPTNKVTVFNQQILGDVAFDAEVTFAAKNTIAQLGLVFGTVYVNRLGTMCVVRKLLTAPKFDAVTMKDFVKSVNNWITDKLHKNKELVVMEQLLK
jgi:hypothetical protein